MFFTYLRRELRHRRKQTVVVATGLGVAIALVMVVSSFSAGVEKAQGDVLASVYGVGTDITVNQAAEFGEGGRPGQQFEFGEDGGTTDDEGTTELSQSRLTTPMGSAAFDATAVDTVAALDHVTGVSAILSLQNTEFSGELPPRPEEGEDRPAGPPGDGEAGRPSFGGGSFGITSTTVSGVDPSADAVGPLTTATVTDGRSLDADDSAAHVAVLDQQYATQDELAVGDTVTLGGTDFEVVGIVGSTSGEGVATTSNVYIPLAVAQTLSELDGKVTDLFVSVDSSAHVDDVKDAVAAALPDASVSTQADLAGDVSGSLATASSLISKLGLALSIVVLVAAFGLAILFTVSGVNRRTRELGTLKAIGWPRRRVVGQVAGEAVAQGVIGGIAGVVLGGVAILAINLAGITLSGGTGGGAFSLGGPGAAVGGPQGGPGGGAFPGGGGPMPGGPFGAVQEAASSTVDVVLRAPVSVWVVLAAVGLAILGGLVAGIVGGRRAARLRPAEALRSLA